EHLEESLSPWLLLEYRHVSMFYGKEWLWFTNIPVKYHRVLRKYSAHVFDKSIIALVENGLVKPNELIILDPQSSNELGYNVLASTKYVLIGGILGDHPPRGRTKAMLTSKLRGVQAYNIGEMQYSIDGAAYYIHYLWIHRGIEGFKYIDGVSIDTDHGSVYLPYRYPLVNGKPLLADGLEYYIKHRKLREDIWRELFSESDG
ncbi:MAG: SAM-dependent methyltransferase, partial [Desulfurococcaceae archaeon]